MRSPRSVCSRASSQTAQSLPMKVRSRRVRVRSMSSTLAMPLERWGGGCASCGVFVRWRRGVKGLAVVAEEWLELREAGRNPPRKVMSGLRAGAGLSGEGSKYYWSGPQAT
jgi:hypothetical protein